MKVKVIKSRKIAQKNIALDHISIKEGTIVDYDEELSKYIVDNGYGEFVRLDVKKKKRKKEKKEEDV